MELAKERKANIGGVTYKLYFSIPAERSEAIMAESTIFFELFDLVPVILDFKEAKENILSVTSSDGKRIPYVFKNEHIIIQPEHLKKGRNELVIQFKAGESSLNRSDDMLSLPGGERWQTGNQFARSILVTISCMNLRKQNH